MSNVMRYRSAPSRRARLLELVREQGFCTTGELVKALGVSDMTVRRDAQRLADEGLVRMVHGGVSVLPQSALDGSGDYEERESRMTLAKQAVGRGAAALVKPGDTVALDAGTTVLELARNLPFDESFTVVTHSATVLHELLGRELVQVVGIGGVLHHETKSFAGASTLSALSSLHVETLYLAASGIGERGVFCANDFDAVTKRALIEIADHIVLVADSSKFTSSAMVRVCDLDAIDRVVVDDAITADHRDLLARHDVEILTVPVPDPSPEAGAAPRGPELISAHREVSP